MRYRVVHYPFSGIGPVALTNASDLSYADAKTRLASRAAFYERHGYTVTKLDRNRIEIISDDEMIISDRQGITAIERDPEMEPEDGRHHNHDA